MAKPTFSLEVPTAMETELTGLQFAIVKRYRANDYRVESWRSGLVITKDDEKVRRWDDVPKAVQKAVQDARAMMASTPKP